MYIYIYVYIYVYIYLYGLSYKFMRAYMHGAKTLKFSYIPLQEQSHILHTSSRETLLFLQT